MRYLVTGGAGFIGSNFIRHLLKDEADSKVTNLDKLTYAGNLENLADIADSPRYRFVRGDICDANLVAELAAEIDVIVNFAAETHVDRSILDPGSFIDTDVKGTYVLLEALRKRAGDCRFIQISTDEVYGSISEGAASEADPIAPRNPYSASKAGADRLAYTYHTTYGLDVMVTRASNNYGPYQYPEKLIPLFISNAIDDKPLPLYGDGLNERDWLHVGDHCKAIAFLVRHGKAGETYNIGGGNAKSNIEITRLILETLGKPESLIRRVEDRPGHDRRYAISCDKLFGMGYSHSVPFERGIKETVLWYRDQQEWWRPLREQDAEFKAYYKRQYGGRLS